MLINITIMKTIKQLIDEKGNNIYSISPEAFVYEALELMAEKDIGALVVTEGNKLVGIFSERDYARKIVLKGKTSKDSRVSELMVKGIYYIHPDKTVQDCMVLMTEKKIRHVPVMENDNLIGIVSIGDVVKAIIKQQRATIKDLENYITGSYQKIH